MNSNILQYPIKSVEYSQLFPRCKTCKSFNELFKSTCSYAGFIFFQINRVYNFFSPELTLVKWYLNPRTVVWCYSPEKLNMNQKTSPISKCVVLNKHFLNGFFFSIVYFFYKQLRSYLSLQSCLYYQDFQDSKLLVSCLVND